MILSHTQLARYLRCPRSYRYRYLDGWREKETRAAMVFGRCFEKALWKLGWFLRDFGYDAELLSHDQVDVRALLNLQGVVRTSRAVINGRTYQNLDGFAPAGEWEALSCAAEMPGQKTS